MHTNRATLAAMLFLAAAGCSGSHGSAGRSQTTAQKPADAPSGASAPAETNGSVASNLPIYPGATKMPHQMNEAMKVCGTSMSMTTYSAKDAEATSVAKWYKDRIANAVQITMGPDSNSANYEIFQPDGSGAAVVMQMHFPGNLGKAAKTLGADETTFATETFDPPLSRDVIGLFVRGTSGDAAAQAAARAQLKAKCGDSGLKAD
ncbi:MAG TPA: hypothetical protein VIJ77_10025 [Candidatus Tumulicola sp.]